jgi:16S rRNA (adenine1518-N6/adenine1519-N6)-dimethyltransferase
MKKTAARLGQHFLANDYYAKVLADAVAVRPGETIVEVGPGKGALTKHLVATGAPVVAIEKDEVLAAKLPELFGDKVTVISGDVRDFVPKSDQYVLAANIPYYITGEIIRQFLEADTQPRAMALLIQKEVAERIVARDGKESILSLSVKVFGTPRIVAKVGKGNFNPPPSVDSAILLVEDISRKNFATHEDERAFFDVVRAGFAAKRKLLSGNLAKVYGKDIVAVAFTTCRLEEKVRAEDLALAHWLALAKMLSAQV